MHITIRNFGPIERFEYDLSKHIIVTYGGNNIGKSYAMQLSYLLLKTFTDDGVHSQTPRFSALASEAFLDSESESALISMIHEFISSDDPVLNISTEFQQYFFSLLTSKYYAKFLNSLLHTFPSTKKFQEQGSTICIDLDKFQLIANLKEHRFTGVIHNESTILVKSDEEYVEDSDAITIPEKSGAYPFQAACFGLTYRADKLYAQWEQCLFSQVRHVYFLPASRAGIYNSMNAFSSIIAELSRKRSSIESPIELPRISEPISDYFIMLSNIKKENLHESSILQEIEEKILNGTVIYDEDKNTLLYKANDMNEYLRLTEVSSMVAEVSPIIAFFKYIIHQEHTGHFGGPSIVFMEEPEAHLHPLNQIAFIEQLAHMANKQLHIVLSSHSNYIFIKLNNLVLTRKINYQVYQPILLERTAKGSVSKSMCIDVYGVEDENFILPSEILYNEREEFIDAYNKGEFEDASENQE